jgi:opacity protein-like surface antigen
LYPVKGYSQTGEHAADALAQMGYENVRWTEDDHERVYLLQNSAYRLEGVGISRAVDLIQRVGMPEGKSCRIIVLDNNVPQISLLYQPEAGDEFPDVSRKDWKVGYDLGDSWKQLRRDKDKVRNSSLYKVDVVVYPELSLKNLVITQVYQVLFNLSPAIEVSLWKGMKLTAQVVIPVYNDGYGDLANKVHPGFLTLQQIVRLPYNLWLTGTLGSFNADRYGVDLKLLHVLKADGRFSFEGKVGMTSIRKWEGFEFHYATKRTWTWSLGANFFWPRYNIQASMKAERYLLGEHALRVDLIRHFRYASIGFYALKGMKKNGEMIRANGGFRFQIALPPYKYKRKGYLPRITPSKNMGIAYNAGNELTYYRGYRSTADDNIMKNNSLNPYYIQSELLNY